MNNKLVSGALVLVALFGTAPPVHAQQEASRATPPPGKTLMLVFRSDRAPVAAQVPVFVNSTRVGALSDRSFVTATVNPGRVLLRLGDQGAPTYAFEAAANQSYFVRVEALAGVEPVRTEVRLVNETEGRRALAQSRFLGAVAIAPGATSVPKPPAPAAAPPRAQPPAAPVAAPPRPPSQVAKPAAREPAPEGDWEFVLIASGGTFKMANDNPTVAGLNSSFDKTSSPVLSVEAEWRSRAGFAAGGEVFYYMNDLTTTVAGASSASQQQVVALLANGKYYFHAADWFYPFVGGGIGFGNALYSGGNLKGSAGGLAYQGLAGMEFRFGSIGLHLQYKYLAATAGKSDKEVKVGGGGILAGVSIAF
jgi:opacity protein-like surface antigen